MNQVLCRTIDGQTVPITKDRLTFRAAVYALVVNDGKLLLLNTKSTGTFSLPGGGVEVGEPLLDALEREVREETGIEIRVKQLAFFREEFFYYEPTDEAFHSLRFFYDCGPRTLELVSDDRVEDDEVERPRWIDVATLEVADFQNNGAAILAHLAKGQNHQ